MKYPLWSQDQFIDATSPGGLNPAAGVVSGSIASVGSATWALPGLLAPEAMTVAFSGMTAIIGLPSPWGLLTSGGIVVRAHGTQTGADTQNYSVNFASLVPGSGSLTAYLAATVTTIQQGPVPIPGPPPGHPAYDPTFVPAVGYTSTAYSVALAAVSGGIDNVNTFELLRTTLTAGQTSLTAYNTAGQYRAPDRDAWPASTLTSGGTLVPGQAQTMQVFGASGVTVTLPPASGAGGLMFGFVNPLAVTGTVATTGSDLIVGFNSTGLSALAVQASGSVLLWANASKVASGQWQIIGGSPITPFSSYNIVTGSRVAETVYTNTTGKPMFVTIDLLSGGDSGVQLLLNGYTSSQFSIIGANVNITLFGMVPPGATYEVHQIEYAFTINGWTETW